MVIATLGGRVGDNLGTLHQQMASLVSPEKVRELLNDGISSPAVDNKRYVLLVLKKPEKMLIATVVSYLARLVRYINLADIKAISMLLKRSKHMMFCIRKPLFSCKDKINILSAFGWIGICMCSTGTFMCSRKALILLNLLIN